MIWPFILLSYAALLVFGLVDNIRGPLFPEIMRDFGVSDAAGSMMFALSNISGLVASYTSRFLLQRIDRLNVLRLASVGLIISLACMAATPYFPLFLVFAFSFGLCMGWIGLVPNILVSMGSSPEHKQRMLSGLHTMYGLASLIAPLMAASVQHFGGNWRATFAAAIISPALLLIYTFHKSHQSLHTKAVVLDAQAKSGLKKNRSAQMYLALMLSFAVAAEIMVSSRLALYMRRVWNYEMEASSLYVTYFFVALMSGRLLFAVIHFKQTPRFILSGSIVLTGAFILLGLYVHPLFLALSGLGIAPFYPLAISWISSEFPQDLDSAVSYMIAIDSLMLIFMHLSIGKLTDLLGIHNAILCGMVFVVLALFTANTYHHFFKRSLPRI